MLKKGSYTKSPFDAIFGQNATESFIYVTIASFKVYRPPYYLYSALSPHSHGLNLLLIPRNRLVDTTTLF